MTQTVSFGSPSGLRRTGNGRTVTVEMRHEEPVTTEKRLTSGSSGGEIIVSASSGKSPVTRLAPAFPKGGLKEPSEEAKRRFGELANRWRRETAHLSLSSRMAKHPAYREIVNMGWVAVPLLLAELKRDADFWFAALREITGENPVPAKSAGRLKEMARAWIKWGQERGYIQ